MLIGLAIGSLAMKQSVGPMYEVMIDKNTVDEATADMVDVVTMLGRRKLVTEHRHLSAVLTKANASKDGMWVPHRRVCAFWDGRGPIL